MVTLSALFTFLLVFNAGLATVQPSEDPECRLEFKYETNGSAENTPESENVKFVVFPNKKNTWDEAEQLCPHLVPGSHLAILRNRKLAEFIACKTGVYNDTQEPKLAWIDAGVAETELLRDDSELVFGCEPETVATLVRTTREAHGHKRCLAFKKSRNSQNIAMDFVWRPCHEQHGFLCMAGAGGRQIFQDRTLGDAEEHIAALNTIKRETPRSTEESLDTSSLGNQEQERPDDNDADDPECRWKFKYETKRSAENTPDSEKVKFDVFPNKKNTWEEAKQLCPQLVPGSHLARLRNRKLAEFIACKTGEYDEHTQDSKLAWIDAGVAETELLRGDSELVFGCEPETVATLVRTTREAHGHKRCLAFKKSRNSQSIAMDFVWKPCHEQHGFLCMTASVGAGGQQIFQDRTLGGAEEHIATLNTTKRETPINTEESLNTTSLGSQEHEGSDDIDSRTTVREAPGRNEEDPNATHDRETVEEHKSSATKSTITQDTVSLDVDSKDVD